MSRSTPPLPLPAFLALVALAFAPSAFGEGRAAPELRVAEGHTMRYWVSRPAGWTAARSWPVLVLIPDASREFERNLRAFMEAGPTSPFLLVAPHVVTSGGSRGYREAPDFRYGAEDWKEVDRVGEFRFDETGIDAVVADVRRRDAGSERFLLTGWEAGGHTVWAYLFRHPERLLGAVPVSTNYLGRWLAEADFSKNPARSTLPVKILFCGSLPAEMEAARQHFTRQTRDAIAAAEAHGFAKPSLEVLEGRPHGPLAADVLARASSLLASSP